MATHIASANGNLTATSTWNDADATSFSNSEAGNSALTTSYVESQAFTPGAITIDALLVKIASRAASPSGTMSVRLAQGGVTVAGTEVTVNVSDIPTGSATSGTTSPVSTAEIGWFMVKLAAPVTLLAATAYTLSGKTSSGSQVNLWRTSTGGDWSRALRKSTNTGSVAAGDDFIITGEWTAAATVTARSVTMDSTAATDYGNNTTTQVTPCIAICNNGTLSFGTAGSTNYILQSSGWVIVYNGGTLNIGSSGAEIPRTSTAKLQFDCGGDGSFGLVARNGSTLNIYGLSRSSGKNIAFTTLNANAAAAATALTVTDDTGWLNGDIIVLAQTDRASANHSEQRTLNADATSSGLSISSGLTTAKAGVAPIQGHIILLTRNVVIKSVTAGNATMVYCGNTATVTAQWAEFVSMGWFAGSNGVGMATTTGSASFSYCSIHDCEGSGIVTLGSTSNNATVQYCVGYSVGTAASNQPGFGTINASSGTNVTFDHNIAINCNTGGGGAFGFGDVGCTVTNNVAVSNGTGASSAYGFSLNESGARPGTFSGNTAYCCGGAGLRLPNSLAANAQISNMTVWRNSGASSADGGVSLTSNYFDVTFVNLTAFGNGNASVYFGGTTGNFVFDNIISNGDTTYSTPAGIFLNTGNAVNITIMSGNFSTVSGIKTAHTNDIDFNNLTVLYQVWADNTIFGGTNVVANFASALANPTAHDQSFVRSQRQDQTNGKHRAYFPQGTILPNTGTVHTAGGLSEQMTPSSATTKLCSQSILVACASGKTCTPTVYVQKDGSYNGNAPRLIARRQDSMGITSDTVLATFSGGSGAWQALSGTTVAATEDGVFEFIVDCDGTAGNIFVDDASAVTA